MLAGLIIATADIEGEAGLRAELPVAGQTLLEHQARLLASVGATHIVVLFERLPGSLLAGIDRLKRDGVAIEIARSVEDAADRVHPDERLIVVADGLVTDRGVLDLLLGQPAPVVLTLPDTPDHAGWERIDATARWGGLLLLDGALVRQTAELLGDWDLQSTLLRRAVQGGAMYVDLPAGDPPATLVVVTDRALALTAEGSLARRTAREFSGYPDRLLFAPLARLVAPRAMGAMVEPVWLQIAATVATAAACVAFLAGWIASGLAALLVAGPLDACARYIGTLGWRSRQSRERWGVVRLALSGAALVTLGWRLSENGGGWGCIVLAFATIAAMLATENHQALIGRPARRPLWLAEVDMMIWLYLPFALAGLYRVGLGALAALAFASLLMVQRLTARRG